ncbi:MAG TPA: patatin-like phospholipase family protein [Acidimicrobiales bacterium]|nr:patatin-like phospholipase family protein [Acidimicrobiales bacterium]
MRVEATDGGGAALDGLLREVAIFSAASPQVIEELAAAADAVFVSAGDFLYRQGDEADGLAIVASGRLEIYFEGPPPAVVGTARRGDVLGELSLLTAGTRAAAVRASRDSLLYRVSRANFEKVIAENPRLGLAIARNLGERLRLSTPLERPRHRPTVFAVVPLDGGLSPRPFVEEFSRAIGAASRVVGTSDLSQSDDAARAEWLDRTESWGATVLLLAETGDRGWFDFCLRSSDRVVLLTRGQPLAELAADQRLRRRDLVFVDGAPARPQLRGALDAFEPTTHHVLRQACFAHDVDRVARRLTGSSIGLVLSGGGARGLAHIGVVERLLAAGIQIDRIGGCSMGGLVGAMLALDWSATQIHAVAKDELVRQRPFSDYRVSRVSLLRAKKAEAMLRRILADSLLEEMHRPFFCVSADLTTGQLVVHRRGQLLDSVGASMSIPGLVPPRRIEGRWLVDGGVLDNLPVDVMAGDGEGPVVAVDVMRGAGPLDVGKTMSPSMLNTVVRATVIGGWAQASENRRAADVLVAPQLSDIGLFDFERFDDAVQAGREAADAALDAIKELSARANAAWPRETSGYRPSSPGR